VNFQVPIDILNGSSCGFGGLDGAGVGVGVGVGTGASFGVGTTTGAGVGVGADGVVTGAGAGAGAAHPPNTSAKRTTINIGTNKYFFI